ncbi:hypothetical protein GCM10017674_58560 [Streptomyces gardneri]|uniref:Uncharacterized protein n=1 Tax=Streptomyces gardneri TaxID=66892 RepID=A0A4Y3RWU7_9ACTN|nr:hypothetical protein SGA01_71530 [Streptomyces gardneri]GHH12436.1 hypothetical protein GCM10017674_58560 [Streptomyces gardneri]
MVYLLGRRKPPCGPSDTWSGSLRTRAEVRIGIATWIAVFPNARRLHSVCEFESPEGTFKPIEPAPCPVRYVALGISAFGFRVQADRHTACPRGTAPAPSAAQKGPHS